METARKAGSQRSEVGGQPTCRGQLPLFAGQPNKFEMARNTLFAWPDDELRALYADLLAEMQRRELRRDPDQVLHSKARAIAGEVRRRRLPCALPAVDESLTALDCPATVG